MCVRVCGAAVERVPVGRLHDRAQVHHGDARADLADRAEIVRDEHVGEPVLLLQVLEQVEDLGLDRHVERRDGLVAHHQPRPQRQRPGDPDALCLAAGELMGVAGGVLRPQAHPLQQLLHRFVRGQPLVAVRGGQDLPDGLTGVERGVRILEDHLQVAAHGPHQPLVQRGQFPSGHRDRARGRLDEPGQQPCDGGLAAAGLADQTQCLSRVYPHRHTVDRPDLSDEPPGQAVPYREPLDQVARLQQRCVHALTSRADKVGSRSGSGPSTRGTQASRPLV